MQQNANSQGELNEHLDVLSTAILRHIRTTHRSCQKVMNIQTEATTDSVVNEEAGRKSQKGGTSSEKTSKFQLKVAKIH